MNTHPHPFTGAQKAALVAFIVLTAGVGYLTYAQMTATAAANARMDRMSRDLYMLASSVASTTQILQVSIAQTHSELADALNRQQQNVQNQIVSYQQQVSSVAGTVNTLQKLSKTDPELLQKYSKVFFLSENYAPAERVEIPTQYRYSDAKALTISTPVWPFLKRLLDDATAAHVNLYAFSAYRSFGEQSALKGNYKVTYGAGSANSFSADQGYSEHQLGTALDFMTSGLGGQLDDRFDDTAASAWLQANAYKYGFILSYPKNNSSYVYEPWHWRFVGVKLATDLHNANKNFADWDQRQIDTYLVSLFDPQ